MKDRFWNVYYYLMVSYLVLALVTIVQYQNTYELYEIKNINGETCQEHENRINQKNKQKRENGESGITYSTWDCVPGEKSKRYLPVSNMFEFSNRVLLFNFIEDSRYSIEIKNYYPFILFFLLTLIRFIITGKHFWQRP